MAIVIRRFDEYPHSYATDLSRIYEDEPSFKGIPSQALTTIEELFSEPKTCLYIAQFNNRWLAAATVIGSDEREVRLLCVRSATRLIGVGSRLMQEIKRIELASGCTRLFTYAEQHDAPANSFYAAVKAERNDKIQISDASDGRLVYSIYSDSVSET